MPTMPTLTPRQRANYQPVQAVPSYGGGGGWLQGLINLGKEDPMKEQQRMLIEAALKQQMMQQAHEKSMAGLDKSQAEELMKLQAEIQDKLEKSKFIRDMATKKGVLPEDLAGPLSKQMFGNVLKEEQLKGGFLGTPEAKKAITTGEGNRMAGVALEPINKETSAGAVRPIPGTPWMPTGTATGAINKSATIQPYVEKETPVGEGMPPIRTMGAIAVPGGMEAGGIIPAIDPAKVARVRKQPPPPSAAAPVSPVPVNPYAAMLEKYMQDNGVQPSVAPFSGMAPISAVPMDQYSSMPLDQRLKLLDALLKNSEFTK